MAISKPLLHPPLSEVAFEINFPRQLLVENRIAEYQQRISESYPHSEDEFVVRLPPTAAFSKAPKREGQGLTPVRSFGFQNSIGTRIVKVSVVNFNFLITDYKDFEDYKKSLAVVLSPGIELFRLQRVDRIGLRYINKISIRAELGAFGFQEYVRMSLDISSFPKGEPSNFLSEVRLKLNDKKNLTVRSGLLPAQPEAPLRTYLLDLDCYSEETSTLAEIKLPGVLEEYHDAIEDSFRRAVTEKYWKYMEHGEGM